MSQETLENIFSTPIEISRLTKTNILKFISSNDFKIFNFNGKYYLQLVKKIYLYKDRIFKNDIISQDYKKFLNYCYQCIKDKHNYIIKLKESNDKDLYKRNVIDFFENLSRFLLILKYIDDETFNIGLLELNLQNIDLYILVEEVFKLRAKIGAIDIEEITKDLKKCNQNIFELETTIDIFDNNIYHYFV